MGCGDSKTKVVAVLTAPMKACFSEDLDLFLELSKEVQNAMIVGHSTKTVRTEKSKEKSKAAVGKLFKEADADKDGALNLEEFTTFSNLMSASLKAKYGGAYTLSNVQILARHGAYDINKNGGVTEEEFWACMELRYTWQLEHYPSTASKEFVALWTDEHKLFKAFDEKVQAAYMEQSKKESADNDLYKAGVQWRLELFDEADANQDGQLNAAEWKTFYGLMEKKLTTDMGGAYTLTDDQLKTSHEQHDLDGNGEVTKDEVVWARKLKTDYYKSLSKPAPVKVESKANSGNSAVLTDAMSICFAEDLDLFCGLAPKVQNAMIVSRASKRKRDPASAVKSQKAVNAIFTESDANNDGMLDMGEWIIFSAKMAESLKTKYGGSYTLDEAQLKARWECYDVNKNGGVTQEDFWACMALREEWKNTHYPARAGGKFLRLWAKEHDLFAALADDVREKYRQQGKKEEEDKELYKAGVQWRLELFDEADANKDGQLNVDEWIAYYGLMEKKLTADMGGAYTLTEKMLRKGHKLHDLDGNGEVTKDEIIWARKLKTKYYTFKAKLSKEISECFAEDLDLFCNLNATVCNKMIVSKAFKRDRGNKALQKSKDAVHKLYVKADANNDTFLNLEEFINFSTYMGDSLKAKYGGSYTLSKEQAEKRFKAYDLNGNGQLSEEEFWECMDLRTVWQEQHYPSKASEAFIKLWQEEKVLFAGLTEEAQAKYHEQGKKENADEKLYKAGVQWRLELFDKADADNDGMLDAEEWKVFYKEMGIKLKAEMGDAYDLTDEQLLASHACHDLDSNGKVTKDEVQWARKLKGRWYASQAK